MDIKKILPNPFKDENNHNKILMAADSKVSSLPYNGVYGEIRHNPVLNDYYIKWAAVQVFNAYGDVYK